MPDTFDADKRIVHMTSEKMCIRDRLMGVNIQDIPFEDPNAREDNGAGEENGCGAVVSGSLAVIAALSITGISLIRKGGRHEND